MTEYPVQCFEHNGEPYGRYVNRFIESVFPNFYKKMEQIIRNNTFPMTGAEIGKTYERDEVDVVKQRFYPDKNDWFDCNDHVFSRINKFSTYPRARQIFRLAQPVEKEPETAEEASEKWFNKLSEIPEYECLTEKNIFTLAFKAGAEYQKQQSK